MPKSQPAETYRLNAGRVFVRPIDIALSDMSDGKHGKQVYVPKSAQETEKLGKGQYAADGRLLRADESCVYGRVVASAEYTNRSTCVPIDKNALSETSSLRDFPLPEGAWVMISGSIIPHKVDPHDNIYSYNTSEIQRWWLPTDPRPRWAPEQ